MHIAGVLNIAMLTFTDYVKQAQQLASMKAAADQHWLTAQSLTQPPLQCWLFRQPVYITSRFVSQHALTTNKSSFAKVYI